MPFHFVCPYCFKKTLVDDALAGQSGPCVACGKTVTVSEAPSKLPEGVSPVDGSYVQVQPERPEMRFVSWILKGLGVLAIGGVLSLVAVYLLWPTFQGLRARRNKVACLNNLQQIARALNAYAAEHGSYPPPIVYDSTGKPMHSWRVLILNELGESSLYARYDFSQPWDSSENADVMALCPSVYVSPAAGDPWGSESTYELVTGNRTVFPKAGPLRPQEIADGADQTLLVVEVGNTTNEWTKPTEIDIGKLNPQIGASGPNTLGGNHEDGATAVFADGEPAWLPEDLDPILLDAILTPAGGEPIDPDDYRLQ